MRISDWSSDVCSSELVHAWLKPLQATWRDDATVLYAPNTFIRDEVRSRYLGRIRELLGHFAGTPEVTLEIGSLPRAVAERTAPALPARTTARSEESRVGKEWVIRVDLGGRRILKNKKRTYQRYIKITQI